MSEEVAPRKTKSERSVDMAGSLIIAFAEGDHRQAGAVLKRVTRQRVPSNVLVVMAIIAAGALKKAYGEHWKDHVTDYPDNLNQESA